MRVIEVFPESRGPQVEHRTPIIGDDLQSLVVKAAFGQRLEHVISVEGRETFRPAPGDHRPAHLAGVGQPGQHEHRRRLLVPQVVGHVPPQPPQRPMALRLHLPVAEPAADFGAGLHGHHHQGLIPGMDHVGHLGRGPVQQALAALQVLAVAVHLRRQHPQQGTHIFLLFTEIVQIALVHIQVAVDNDPPHRVGRDPVHPPGQRRIVAHVVEAPAHDLIAAEHALDGHHLGVHVPEPYQAVAFHPVPEVLLHIEVDGIGPRLPDAVQPFIIAAERPQIRDVAVTEDRPHGFQIELRIGLHQVDPHEAEPRVPGLDIAQPRHAERKIAQRMLVRGAGHRGVAADVAHRLAHRFAQADPHLQRPLVGAYRRRERDPAAQLLAEIEQHGSRAPVAGREAADIGCPGRQLPVEIPEQRFGVFHPRRQLAGQCDQPQRGHVPA